MTPDTHAPSPARKAYGFEHIVYLRRYALYDRSSKYYETFIANLGITPPENADDQALLHEYVATVHVNANWYNKKVRSEKALQVALFLVSVALLGLVPLVVYHAPQLLNATSASANIGARIPILLAGFYAVHRSMSSWISQRRLISPYWNARSKLIEKIYTIETDWRSRSKRDNGGSFCDDFRTAIKASIQEARQIVKDERTVFFSNYAFPDINVPTFLSTAASSATSTIGSFESPASKRLLDYRTQVADQSANVSALAIKRQQLQTDKEDAETRRNAETAGSEAYIALNAEVKGLAESLGAVMADEKTAAASLLQAKAKLAAALRS